MVWENKGHNHQVKGSSLHPAVVYKGEKLRLQAMLIKGLLKMYHKVFRPWIQDAFGYEPVSHPDARAR